MTTPQEDFVAGAEAEAARLGERHGFSMLSAGLENMLRERGYDFTSREIANLVHHHYLSEFLDQGAKPETVDLSKLAHAFDTTFMGKAEPSWELSNVLGGRATAGLGYYSPNLRWIETQVTNEIKTRKIRKNTKRYGEFVQANAAKIYAAAVEETKKAAKVQQDAILRRLEQLNQDRDKFVANKNGRDRALSFRDALLSITETPADPRAEEGVASRKELFNRGLSAYDTSIDYLQRQVAELEESAETGAKEAMSRSETLSPFLRAMTGI